MGLLMTIFSRYMVIFPSKWQQFFQRKELYVCIAFFHVLAIFVILYIMIRTLNFSDKELYEDAKNYDPDLAYFFNRSTFFFVSYDIVYIGNLVTACGMSALYVTAAIVVIVFLYQISSNKNIINNKIQKSLIISSVMQVTLASLFLLTPLYCYFIFMYFEVTNTAPVMTVLLCIYLSHCVLDLCATIYFVKPYKTFVLRILSIKNSRTSEVMTTRLSSDIRVRPKVIIHSIR